MNETADVIERTDASDAFDTLDKLASKFHEVQAIAEDKAESACDSIKRYCSRNLDAICAEKKKLCAFIDEHRAAFDPARLEKNGIVTHTVNYKTTEIRVHESMLNALNTSYEHMHYSFLGSRTDWLTYAICWENTNPEYWSHILEFTEYELKEFDMIVHGLTACLLSAINDMSLRIDKIEQFNRLGQGEQAARDNTAEHKKPAAIEGV